MEDNDAIITERSPVWSLPKLSRAKRMLQKGMTPRQIGSQLQLSEAMIAELEVDAEDIEPAVALESFADYKKRKTQEITRKMVGISEKMADAAKAVEGTALAELMPAVQNASQIAHKWLAPDAEGVKHLTLNFSALAQAKPCPPPSTVIEIGSEVGDDPNANEE